MRFFTRYVPALLAAVVLVGMLAACGGGGDGGNKTGTPPRAKRADFRDDKAGGIEMVYVKGGAFKMGGCNEKWMEYCGGMPGHNVTVGDFYIGKYEVTQKQWFQVMGEIVRNSEEEEWEALPVRRVSWIEVEDFLARLNAIVGRNYRLPTEAEWEFASRGGVKSKGYIFAGSNNPDDVAWFQDNSGDEAHPVGTKGPNELGIYDMSGNVWEWVSDWYGGYSSLDVSDPKGPPSGSDRVYRGGSWDSDTGECQVFNRGYDGPGARSSGYPGHRPGDLGFRLALSPQ
jgi:formylglycine-generating enzyme required for sulfatase activity